MRLECSADLKYISRQIGCERKVLNKNLYGRLIAREKYRVISRNKLKEERPNALIVNAVTNINPLLLDIT